jgi:carboxypeptidase T
MSRFFISSIIALALSLACFTASASIPGYPCYRTVEETETAMWDLAAAYPGLAAVIDIGNSWEKSEPGMTGYDIYCLRLTNSAVAGPSPWWS